MIGFRKLEVSNFKGIESAVVVFTKGLNILYGDNELGKSSLLAAIRAAMFLPVKSSEANDYQSWGTSFQPTVSLNLTVNGNEYQIYKQFGAVSGSKSELRRIDSSGALKIASGRKVDTELRKLIAWGIPEPGSRGGSRGLPQSYLSNALLSFQDEVESILSANIDADKADSGKQAITDALGTLGQDTLVTALLDQLEIKTIKVYTPTGQLKRTTDSPLMEKTSDTQVAEYRLQQLTRELDNSQSVEDSLRDLKQSADSAQHNKTEIEKRMKLARKAVDAENSLGQSKNKEAEIEGVKKELSIEQQAAEKKLQELKIADNSAASSESEVHIIQTELARAQQKYQSLDEINATSAEAKRTSLNAQIRSIETRISTLRTTMRLSDDVTELREQRIKAETVRNTAKQSLEKAEYQLQYSELQADHDRCLKEIHELEGARKKYDSLRFEFNELEIKCRHLNVLIKTAMKASELRQELDQDDKNQSALDLAARTKAEAQITHNNAEQKLLESDQTTSKIQAELASSRQQLATLQGRRQTHSDSAVSMSQQKEESLRSNIATAEQKINIANNAATLLLEINESEEYVEQLRVVDSKDSIETHHSVNNEKSDGKRLSKMSLVLGLTTIISVALVLFWYTGFMKIGIFIAPVTALTGMVIGYKQWTGFRSSSHNYIEFPSRSTSIEREKIEEQSEVGAQTDQNARDDTKGGNPLANTENELVFKKKKYEDLVSQLDDTVENVLNKEKHRVHELSSELTRIDSQHSQIVKEIDNEIKSNENSILSVQEKLNNSQIQHDVFNNAYIEAQKYLATSEARLEQLVQFQDGARGEKENKFSQLKSDLESVSDTEVDYSSIVSIETLLTSLKNRAQQTEDQLNTEREVLANAKAELNKREQTLPKDRLASAKIGLAELSNGDTHSYSSISPSDAKNERDLALEKLTEGTSQLEYYKGQEQAKEYEFEQQNLPKGEPLDVVLVGLTKELGDKEQERDNALHDNPQEKNQLLQTISGLETQYGFKKKAAETRKSEKNKLAEELKLFQEKVSQSQGKLNQLETQNNESTRQNAQNTLNKIFNESNGVFDNSKSLTSQLESLQNDLKVATKTAKDCEKQLQMSRGQLELIGGSVLRDQIERQEETLYRIREDAVEFEKQCEAEKYLQDVINSCSEKYTAHLGREFAAPVTQMFNELTGQRYGEFTLEPTLIAKAVTADGGNRDYKQLSIGTRQQLAVLVKLALAAHLKACLILDDQLVQSDPERMVWFQEKLSSSVRDYDHQVIVFTCRPEDYGVSCESSENSSSVDLKRVVQRRNSGVTVHSHA